jgi:hypothetical protein
MTTYIEYQLEDGSTLLVETAEAPQKPGISPAGRREEGKDVIIPAPKGFQEALAGVKSSVTTLREELAALKTDEVEVQFGIKVTSSGGIFAIVQASAEVNYTVTLKWKKPTPEADTELTPEADT